MPYVTSHLTIDQSRWNFNSRVKGRRAFTMVEVILVMVILVAVAALTIPAIQNTVTNQALRKSADRVRVAMGQARVQAIRNGDVYAMFYEPNGQWFEVAPLESYAQFAQRRINPESTRQVDRDYSENLLPRDVKFVSGEVGVDNRSESAKIESSGTGGLQAILFYPDGTSQDARLVLQNKRGNVVAVELRGLTGVARTVRTGVQQ